MSTTLTLCSSQNDETYVILWAYKLQGIGQFAIIGQFGEYLFGKHNFRLLSQSGDDLTSLRLIKIPAYSWSFFLLKILIFFLSWTSLSCMGISLKFLHLVAIIKLMKQTRDKKKTWNSGELVNLQLHWSICNYWSICKVPVWKTQFFPYFPKSVMI